MSSLTDEIKRKVRIEELLGIGPGVGRYTRIQCPMPAHDDKDPSCSVNHKANRFRCFACDEKGSVIDLVMKRDGRTLKEAIKELAERANIPFDKQKLAEAEEEWTREKGIRRAIRYAADYYHRKIYDSPGAISYLAQRFVSLDIVEKMKIGIADGSLWTHLQTATLDKLSLLDFANAGLIKKSDKDEGVYRDFFQNRITFPLFAHGDILNISGRAYPDAKPKYLHLPGRDMNHFYNEDAIEEAVKDREASHTLWLFEGHMDTLSGIKAGLPSVGVVGTGGMTCPEKLDSIENLYICGDMDDAGQKAIQDWVKKIQKHFVTVKIKLVELPDGIKDFNEWYKKNDRHIAEKLRELQAGAKDPIAFKISKLHMAFEVDTIWPLIRHKSETERSLYFHKIKERLSGTTVKGLAADFKKWEKDEQEKPTPKTRKLRKVSGGSHVEQHPANQWIDKTAGTWHVCVCVKTEWEDEESVTERYEPVVLRAKAKAEGGYSLEVTPLSAPHEFKPNSWDQEIIKRPIDAKICDLIVNEEADENTAKLFHDLVKYFRTYIWHKDPRIHHLLAAWTMGTYIIRMFSAFPMLVLNGPRNSGKTTVLDMLKMVCFNAEMSGSISKSALFRSIESGLPTLLLDETEDLDQKTPENADMLRLLNMGYRNNGNKVKLTRLDKGGNGTQERYDIFCAKASSCITKPNPTLLSRCILIRMTRPKDSDGVNLPEFDEDEPGIVEETSLLRSRLYAWFFSRNAHMQKTLRTYDLPEEYKARDRQVWRAILAICEQVDIEGGTAFTQDSVCGGMILLSSELMQVRKQQDVKEDQHIQILKTIRDLIKNRKSLPADEALGPITHKEQHRERYHSARICKLASEVLISEGLLKLKTPREESYIKPHELYSILRNYEVTTDESELGKKIRDLSGNRVRCVHIPEARLDAVLAAFSSDQEEA